MKTPIVDFVRKYSQSGCSRFHMPGHKGKSFLGCEENDITEIDGADVLYSPTGIILESENNATELFGSRHTYYVTEGSSLSIKAMLAIATQKKRTRGERPCVLAARNVHRAFVYGCALLDIDVEWLFGGEFSHFCECRIEEKDLEERLEELRALKKLPDAVYITSPDYLGHIADIEGLSRVCDSYKIPLLVDNAHGAYLSFLKESKHPLDLGAAICCDSAHKTLPVLTGGAYLHISKKADPEFAQNARRMLSLFASTSPSYLMLESLDACNAYLSDGYVERLDSFAREISRLKECLLQRGYRIESGEPMKIVISAIGYSFSGVELAKFLRERKIEVEFADRDFTVLMPTPENDIQSLKHLEKALLDFEFEKILNDRETKMKAFTASEREMSIREAMFAESETVDCERAVGRICSAPTVSCPPAVPIAVSGERINSEQAELLKYYGIEEISVVK